jgi:hypothetical protein
MRFLLYVWMASKATLNRGTDILFDQVHLDLEALGKKLQCIVPWLVSRAGSRVPTVSVPRSPADVGATASARRPRLPAPRRLHAAERKQPPRATIV